MAYAPAGENPKRAFGFVFVVLFHILLVYGLVSGLAREVVEVIKGPLETKLIEEIKPEDEPPPPPPPDLVKPPPPQIIMPEIMIEAPPAPSETAITTTDKPPPKAAPKPPSSATPPRANPRRPNTQPEYPPTSKRLGEQGTVTLLLVVNEEGKVADAKVDVSSGFERLDEAAVKEALRSWRFLPATMDGKPVAAQHRVKVTFKITD